MIGGSGVCRRTLLGARLVKRASTGTVGSTGTVTVVVTVLVRNTVVSATGGAGSRVTSK